MKKLIIINAYPNNEEKISLLREQLHYLKKLDIKILVVSGCDVPENLRNQIDYLIVNTDNFKIGKDHTYKCYNDLSLKDTCFNTYYFHNSWYALFGSHVNVTIAKNIKLAFKMAQMLGYKIVLYTEDDHIFKEGSFEFINTTLDDINNDKYKLASCKDFFANSDTIWTAYFFANAEFIVDKFTIPDTIEDYYKDELILKYKLQKPFEVSFYHIMQNDLHLFKDIKPEIDQLRGLKYIDDGKNIRFSNKDWVVNNMCYVLPRNDKSLIAVCHNLAFSIVDEKLREEFKNVDVDIYFDDVCVNQISLYIHGAYFQPVPNDVKKVKFNIRGFIEKEYDASYESAKYAGFIE